MNYSWPLSWAGATATMTSLVKPHLYLHDVMFFILKYVHISRGVSIRVVLKRRAIELTDWHLWPSMCEYHHNVTLVSVTKNNLTMTLHRWIWHEWVCVTTWAAGVCKSKSCDILHFVRCCSLLEHQLSIDYCRYSSYCVYHEQMEKQMRVVLHNEQAVNLWMPRHPLMFTESGRGEDQRAGKQCIMGRSWWCCCQGIVSMQHGENERHTQTITITLCFTSCVPEYIFNWSVHFFLMFQWTAVFLKLVFIYFICWFHEQ